MHSTIRATSTVAVMSLVAAGCGGLPDRIDTVEQARESIAEVSGEPLAGRVAGQELQAARDALASADEAYEEGEPIELIEHRAYVAQRYADISRELVSEAQWSPDPNVRRQPADYPLEISSSPITPVMYNAVGGSTVHFCAQWVRMRPQDFKLRSVDGLADDWPISYEELKPYYERIDQDMQISGMTGDPAYPPGPAPARQCRGRASSSPGWGEVKAASAKASSQVPEVLAFEYSVARFSKKLVCSIAFSISSSQGSGFFSMW